MKITQQKQKNGLDTIYVNSTGSTLGSVQIWFRAGSALEGFENEGIAHFLEHMFFKGTKKRPGARIASSVESFGGEINAFTSFDYTCYYINCPDDKIVESTDILMDMVSNPEFLQKELEPEREVVFEEYRRSIDNPNQYSFFQIQKNSFADSYGHPILGREETIKNFSRKQLNGFRNKYYNTENSFLVVAGDLQTDKSLLNKLNKKINQYKLPKGKKSSFPKFLLKKNSKSYCHLKDVEMAQINLCFQAPPLKSNEAAKEDLAINCLGHGQSSILYRELVLKETLVNACSSTTMFMRDGGLHFLRLNVPVDNVDKATNELLRVLKEKITNGFDEDEITKIKNQYLASKTYEQESLENYSFSRGHSYASTEDLESETTFIDEISAVTCEETNIALKNIFSRNLHLSVQLPLEEKKNLKKWKTKLKKVNELFSKELRNEKIIEKANKTKFVQSKFDTTAKLFDINKQVQLFYKKNDSAPTFVFHTYIQGGLSTEDKKNNGIHNLISQNITMGYGKVTHEEIQRDLDFKAANMSGFAGKNAYGITANGLTTHFNDILDHSMKSFFEPSFNKENFEHERELTLRAIEMSKKDPVKQCFKRASEILFNNHPYAFSLQGDEKSVKNFKPNDLQKAHKKNLQKGKIVFSYSGNLDSQKVIEAVEDRISKYTFHKPEKSLFNNKVVPLLNQNIHIDFDREQTQIFVGLPTKNMKSKDHLYLKMLTSYLGGQSSPLFVDVRDKKGLCYTAQPVHFAALETGYWGIYMASGFDKVEKAKEAIYDLLGKIEKNGLSKADYNKIKNKISGSQKLQLQTNSDFINFYTINSLHDLGIDFFHKQLKEISNLKYEEFQKNIKRILKSNKSIITVGK